MCTCICKYGGVCVYTSSLGLILLRTPKVLCCCVQQMRVKAFYSHIYIYKIITLMLFGCVTNIPKFTSFVFSKSLHAREIKPTRKKQIFYDFTPTMPGPKMSQRSVSYGLLSFSQKTQMAVSGFLGAFLFPPSSLKLLRK